MADVTLEIGGRSYLVACRDGGEEHLRMLAAHVDQRIREAASAIDSDDEVRKLLFGALLVADELTEAKAEGPGTGGNAMVTGALHTLADRIEAIADALEAQRVKA